MINATNDKDKEFLDPDMKDDWAVDNSSSQLDDNDRYIVEVPSFIRLFIIRRIICKSIDDSTSRKDHSSIIKQLQLVDTLSHIDDSNIKPIASNILIRLINSGILKYMSK